MNVCQKTKYKERVLLTIGVLFGMMLLAACTPLQLLPTTMESSAETVTSEASGSSAVTSTDAANTGEGAESESLNTAADENEKLLPADAPAFNTTNWVTDFSRRTVEWSEILSGGPPKDGIPSVDEPTFEPAADATERLSEQEPVIVFEHENEAKAYPLSILIWHEIVNDEVGGKPVSVTFCPLCNASIVFDREFDGEILDFGTTGRLRNSDLIMYDRQSETWWQQFTGEGLIGTHAGRQLTFLPSQVLSFADFVDQYDGGLVMETPEFRRQYGTNPYSGYDTSSRPFLFSGEIDERLSALERVVGVDLDGSVMAYSFIDAGDAGAINDEVAGMPLVVLHKDGTASALDSAIIENGRDIGSVGVFSRVVGGQTLTFNDNGDGTFLDEETGSTWLITGEAVEGELAGTQLERVISFDHFWFAWSAFFPETGLYGG